MLAVVLVVASTVGCGDDVPPWVVVAPRSDDGAPIRDRDGRRIGTFDDVALVEVPGAERGERPERLMIDGGWVRVDDLDFCPDRIGNLRERAASQGDIEALEVRLEPGRVTLDFHLDLTWDGFSGSYRCVPGARWPSLEASGCGAW